MTLSRISKKNSKSGCCWSLWFLCVWWSGEIIHLAVLTLLFECPRRTLTTSPFQSALPSCHYPFFKLESLATAESIGAASIQAKRTTAKMPIFKECWGSCRMEGGKRSPLAKEDGSKDARRKRWGWCSYERRRIGKNWRIVLFSPIFTQDLTNLADHSASSLNNNRTSPGRSMLRRNWSKSIWRRKTGMSSDRIFTIILTQRGTTSPSTRDYTSWEASKNFPSFPTKSRSSDPASETKAGR